MQGSRLDPAAGGRPPNLFLSGTSHAMPPKVNKGAKAKKGITSKAARRGAGNAHNNPRAFAASGGVKAMRHKAYRTLEMQEKKYHVALVDRSVEATVLPPFTVVVVGPAGVGKTTVITSLVKHWTKQVRNTPCTWNAARATYRFLSSICMTHRRCKRYLDP